MNRCAIIGARDVVKHNLEVRLHADECARVLPAPDAEGPM